MLRVIYSRAAELLQDIEGQLRHGGLLVKVAPPAGLSLRDRIAVEIVAPDGTVVRAEGEVLHVQHDGHGVAVTFPAAEVPALRTACGRGDGPAPGPARHEHVVTGGAAAPSGAAAPADAAASPAPPEPVASGRTPRPVAGDPRRIETMGTAEKIQVALHGTKDERAAILRDRNRTLHAYVLKNPQMSADEALAIAKSATSAPDLLGQIAERREWIGRSAIALALARNPRTPPTVGVRALDHVALPDLRQLAKGGAPPHITDAARKKVIKP